MTDDKVFGLAGQIMPTLVWSGGADCLWPIDADKSSVAVASAVIKAAMGKCPPWKRNFFDIVGGQKEYFDLTFLAINEASKNNILGHEFMEAVLYLLEPQEGGDIRDPGISTVFAERWGFGVGGWQYPDSRIGNDCHVRRKILEYGHQSYTALPDHIKDDVNKVASHIPPMLKKILEIE